MADDQEESGIYRRQFMRRAATGGLSLSAILAGCSETKQDQGQPEIKVTSTEETPAKTKKQTETKTVNPSPAPTSSPTITTQTPPNFQPEQRITIKAGRPGLPTEFSVQNPGEYSVNWSIQNGDQTVQKNGSQVQTTFHTVGEYLVKINATHQPTGQKFTGQLTAQVPSWTATQLYLEKEHPPNQEPLNQGELEQVKNQSTLSRKAEKASEILSKKNGRYGKGESIQANQQYLTDLKSIIHNQLNYGMDEIKIRPGRTAGNLPYTRILHQTPNGKKKDLAAHSSNDEGYLRHNEEPSLNNSTGAFLARIWRKEGGQTPMVLSGDIRKSVAENESYEGVSKERWYEAARRLDKMNDFPLMADNLETGQLGYDRDIAGLMPNIYSPNIVNDAEIENRFENNLSAFYHNRVGPDSFVRVNVADNRTEDVYTDLVSVDGTQLIAEAVSESQHLEDAAEIYIPDQKFDDSRF